MSGPLPPEARLREMFESEATRVRVAQALLEPHYADWRKAKLFHTWDMVSCFLGLNQTDCADALEGTLAALTNAMKAAYLPRIALLRELRP